MLNRLLVVLAMLAVFPLFSAATDLIPYKIIEESKGVRDELVIDVSIELVNDRLPNEQELVALSTHLMEAAETTKEVLVRYYLPGMPLGAGAYASVQPTRNLDVTVQEWRLMLDPRYSKYVKAP